MGQCDVDWHLPQGKQATDSTPATKQLLHPFKQPSQKAIEVAAQIEFLSLLRN